jgi:hypothetical protein
VLGLAVLLATVAVGLGAYLSRKVTVVAVAVGLLCGPA